MNTDRIISLYDATIKDAGLDGMKVAEARDKVAAAVRNDPDGFEVPPLAVLIETYVGAVIGEARNARAKQKMPLFIKCHDAVTGLTILGKDDPILDVALRTGATDGLDKALRYFFVEDWLDVLGASAENVSAAIEADRELRTVVNPIVAAYGARGARCFQDLI